MAIGGGGGGGRGGDGRGGGGRSRGQDGEVKKVTVPKTTSPFFGSRSYLESNGAILCKNDGACRDRSADTYSRSIKKESITGNSSNRADEFLGQSLENDGGMLVMNEANSRIASKRNTEVGNREHLLGGSLSKGQIAKNPSPSGYQAGPCEEFTSDTSQPSKRIKSDESAGGSLAPTRELSIKNFQKRQEDVSEASKCKATPPPDWQKGSKRLSMNIASSKTMKNLSFAAPANPSQHVQGKESSTIKVPCASSRFPSDLSIKLIPLPKKESASVLANNNNKKKKRMWEDIPCCSQSNSQFSSHSLFMCNCERKKYDKKVTDIAMGPIAKNISIPGSASETEIMTTCRVIDEIVKSITTSHRNDMCYYGRFSLRNFFCNSDGNVKMDDVQPEQLTSQGSKLDKKQVAAMIRMEFFLSRVVPPAIESLLTLLEAEDTKNTELIEDHSSVQPPLKKLALCEFMYRNFISIKGSQPKMYQAIVKEVEARVNCKGWKTPAKLNCHLNKVLEHKNPGTNLPTKYDETAEGLLHCTYNSIKHLSDYAYENGVQQYDDQEIDHIISGTFPGLIEAFQEAMFHQGRLFKLD